MPAAKKDPVVDAVAGAPYYDEKRKVVVAPDGATNSFGQDTPASTPAPPSAEPEPEGGEE